MEIKKEIIINASSARVYKAITDPEQVTQWFPDIESIEPKIGGKILFKFFELDTADRQSKNSKDDHMLEGKIIELEKNKKLTYTWGHSEIPDSAITKVSWVLEEIGKTKKTRVTILHTGFLDEISMNPYNEQWDWIAECLNSFAGTKKRLNCNWKQILGFISVLFSDSIEKIKPANGRVDVKWQIVFAYIPGVLFWSFYRIKKLRLFLIMMVIPIFVSMYVVPLAIVGTGFFEDCNPGLLLIWPDSSSCYIEEILIPSIVIELIYHGFRTYFIVRWSRQWNEGTLQGVKV